ncbi:unnamed protein product [Alopecurus aequalis]
MGKDSYRYKATTASGGDGRRTGGGSGKPLGGGAACSGSRGANGAGDAGGHHKQSGFLGVKSTAGNISKAHHKQSDYLGGEKSTARNVVRAYRRYEDDERRFRPYSGPYKAVNLDPPRRAEEKPKGKLPWPLPLPAPGEGFDYYCPMPWDEPDASDAERDYGVTDDEDD